MTRTPPELTDALLAGDRRAVARAISRMEHGGPEAGELRSALAPHLGRAHVVGLTGSPGAGKSTLVNALLGALLAQGQRVGVVAVDPSSPISGGALLGDRVRMTEHGEHPNAFIRSIASRGQLGGLSRATHGIVDLLDAAGFDTVIVETVGAGQSEVEVMRLADTCIVACPPGLGDDVQAIKAGILEIADLLVVTKADLPGAHGTKRDLRQMTHLRPAPIDGGWQTQVLSVTATTGDGIAALVEQIAAHEQAAGRGRRLHSESAAVAVEAEVLPPVTRLKSSGTFASRIGIEISEHTGGRATSKLQLRAEHLDDAGACDRSVVFALADCALNLAFRSLGRTLMVVESQIKYLRAACSGDVLVASASESSRSPDRVIYRVDVVDGATRPVATLIGTVRVELPAPG